MTKTIAEMLQDQCNAIALTINNGYDCSAADYLSDTYDTQFLVTREGAYIAARVCVAVGGPDIWIDTRTQRVEGQWGSTSCFADYYRDPMGIDETLAEMWDCR